MNELEYKELIDREGNIKDVHEHFSNQINLLRDLVNYGSNLIPRVFVSSNRKISDTIIIGVLLKQIITMADGVEILISNAAVHSAFILARAAYESSIYIEWILKSDTEKKTKYYYVSSIRNELIWLLRSIEGTEENEKFKMVKDQFDLRIFKDFKNIEDEAKNRVSQINNYLMKEDLKEINDHFEKLKNQNRQRREPNWYKPLNVNSIRQISKEVNRLVEYEIFYGQGSRKSHTGSYRDHLIFEKDKFRFKPIRNNEDIDTLLNFLITIIFKSYRAILSRYRREELLNFRKKYLESWQQAFMNIKKVKYTYSDKIII